MSKRDARKLVINFLHEFRVNFRYFETSLFFVIYIYGEREREREKREEKDITGRPI